MEFEPEHFQQAAGLVCYYGGNKFHYLYVSHDEAMGKHLRVMSALPDSPQADAFTTPVADPGRPPVELRVEVDYERLLFAYRVGGGEWTLAAAAFDASILSDEATAPGAPELHRRLRRDGLPGHGRHRRVRPTSTGSSTASGSTWPTPAGKTVDFL